MLCFYYVCDCRRLSVMCQRDVRDNVLVALFPQTHLDFRDVDDVIDRKANFNLRCAVFSYVYSQRINDLNAVDPPVDFENVTAVKLAVVVVGYPDSAVTDVVTDSIEVARLLAVKHPETVLVGI